MVAACLHRGELSTTKVLMLARVGARAGAGARGAAGQRGSGANAALTLLVITVLQDF